MVVSKEGKRRRKVSAIAQAGGGSTNPSAGSSGANGPITTAAAERDLSPPEIPKRPKVHAQRKFAQGQGTASSSYLSYSSAPPTPGKDGAHRSSHAGTGNGTTPTVPGSGTGSEANPPQVPELLPNMRPNTEDFLTFLCFRGTPVLPPALDFFNKTNTTSAGNSSSASGGRHASTPGGSGSSKQKSQQSKTAATSTSTKESPAPIASPSSNSTKAVEPKKEENATKSSGLQEPATQQEKQTTPTASAAAPTTTYIPFAVRKRAEQHPAPAETRSDRKRTQDKMQALRKKYHDQRVAKLRATTQGQRQSGRVNVAIATRSSAVPSKSAQDEQQGEEDEEEEADEEEDGSENEPLDEDEVEKEEMPQDKKPSAQESPTVGKRKSGLRSGAASRASSPPKVESAKGSPAKIARNAKRDSSSKATSNQQEETGKESSTKTPNNRASKHPSPPDTPVEDGSKVSGTRSTSSSKKSVKESPKNSPTQHQQQQQQQASSNVSDQEGKEKRTTRLSALRNPPPVAANTDAVKNAKDKRKQQPQQDRVDFSSDDDEPLSRATAADKRSSDAVELGKTTRSGRSRKSEPATTALEKDPDEMPDKKTRRSESVVSRRSDISSRKSEMREFGAGGGGGGGAVTKKVEELTKTQPQRGRKRKEPAPTTQPQPVSAKTPKEDESKEEEEPSSDKDRKQAGPAGARKGKRETPAPEHATTPARDSTLSPEVEEKKPKTASSTPVESLSTSRPSRKTKEAATLYMELIGRKLNHDDKSDDDASSLDSLELPNVRKLERMENELKANAGKTRDARQQAATAKGGSKVKKKEDGDDTKVNEKSFSDSDEEPLASKFQRKQAQQQTARRQPVKSKTAASTKTAPQGGRRNNGKKPNDADGSEEQSSPEKTEKETAEKASKGNEVMPKKGGTTATLTTTAVTSPPAGIAKQNGTMESSVAIPLTATKTPTKMNPNSAFNSPLESPVLSSDHLKSPTTSEGQNVSRLNKSMDNTQLSTTVEPAESPIKIPQMLNIPTVIPTTAFLQVTGSPTAAPFTRAIKPAPLGTGSGTGADGGGSSFLPLNKSAPGTAAANASQTPADTSVPFNRSGTTTGAVGGAAGKGDFTLPLDDSDFLKGFEKSSADPSTAGDKPAGHSSLLGNLLPSKEESEKIFGIASVSLAQSSGPLDTKCTLGKCGSVHKPPLGPPVLTESLLGGNLSPRDRRKAKVNMTHEQIQKWIYESSWSPIEDDLKDDDLELIESGARTPPAPPPTTTAVASMTSTSSSVQQTTTSPAVTTATAQPPTTVAGSGWAAMMTAVATSTPLSTPTVADRAAAPGAAPTTSATEKKDTVSQPAQETKPAPSNSKDTAGPKSEGQPVKEAPAAPTPTSSKQKELKEQRKSKAETPPSTVAPVSATTPRTAATTPTATAGERKPIYRNTTGRTPVYKQEALAAKQSPAAQSSQLAPVLPASTKQVAQANSSSSTQASNKFGAFSPVNEPSVYSFDKEEDFMPVATVPFRRQHGGGAATVAGGGGGGASGRRESSNEPATGGSSKRDDERNAFQKPATGVSVAASKMNSDDKSKPLDSVGEKENGDRKEEPAHVKQEASDTEPDGASGTGGGIGGGGQTFYIPLQGPTASGGGGAGGGSGGGVGGSGGSAGKAADSLIQGVAVKLGTEGPDGPNQRVIMHAKLVTKAEMGSNPTTLPDSMNVQELVKSLTAQGGAAAALGKEGLAKLLPIGLLQSRFKSTSATNAAEQPPSTTDAARTPTQEDRASAEPMSRGLSRIASNSSLSSQRSKPTGKAAGKGATAGRTGGGTGGTSNEAGATPQPNNNTVFPRRDDPAQMVEAPVFKPTEKEFHDPMEYIERIAPIASRFGICRIIPPASFKPECRIADDMRFMAYNQYVHKMLHRWGPSAKEYAAIKKYLATQSINLQSPPVIGGMEVDLPRLYHTVQELGGLKEVIEKKKWARVSEDMCIPKAAHDRVSKLDDIYCKYLLPYDTLSPAERQKLFDEVEADWAKREAKARRNADKGVGSEIRNSGDSDEDESNDDGEEDDEEEEDEDECSMECIVKGRSMPLNQFFRIARNTMSLWFRNSEPSVAEIEAEYWRHVAVRDSHVCVHSGSIDSSAFGYGFPNPKVKGSSCAKHPWNLKVLTNNSGSILRSLGPVMGITIPTLHVGMLFSACCWYRDPHGLPWIEYLHTGANKIWYGVPDDQNSNFRAALTVLVPTHCQNKTIWLPCDTAMVPPHMLTDRSVSLCRTEQQPGQFVVVFPRAYTSSLCTGYAVSESVYFATNSWLDTAKEDFRDIQESCEPTMFSVEQLLFAIANDQRSNHDTLVQAYPMIVDIYEKEKQHRQTLKEQGVTKSERIESKKKSASLDEFECERCRANLYLSLVKVRVTNGGGDDDEDEADDSATGEEEEEEEERIYCLKHAVKHLADGGLQTKHCRLAYTYSLEDIEELLKKLQDRIANKKSSKSSAGSSVGGAGGGAGGGGAGGGGGGSGRGKSSLHLASTSSQSSSSYQAPSHSKYAGMATMLK
ncbi:mucin-19 [Anopheles stephensi]|uniref:mucin-19 n=1 Tax=Anopheles stephensi TaxID=30069 RepID=UPI001658A14A|nr:mucin-19 [Anopheles stephensi]